jgi:hypothetical protein
VAATLWVGSVERMGTMVSPAKLGMAAVLSNEANRAAANADGVRGWDVMVMLLKAAVELEVWPRRGQARRGKEVL